MRQEFTSGAWIDIVPIQALKAKHKDVFEDALRIHVAVSDQGAVSVGQGGQVSMGLMNLQRDALLSVLISAWSFVADDETPLPVPTWDRETMEIKDHESFGEIPIDDWNELEEFFAPYIAKVRRRPSPKETTTDGSNGTSPARPRSRQRA